MTAATRVCCPWCRNFTPLDQLGAMAGHRLRPGRPQWCPGTGLMLAEAMAWVAGRLSKANVKILKRRRDRLVST